MNQNITVIARVGTAGGFTKMKNKIFAISLVLGLMGFIGNAVAGENCPNMTQKPVSVDLEKMKGLAGTWKGSSVKAGKEEPVTTEYSVTSGGSAVVEKLFTGTDHEMVSIYHDRKGKLSMTHYCMLGNQPVMDLKTSGPKEMQFEMKKKSGIDSKKETHMHALRLSTPDEKTLVQDWTIYVNGKPAGVTTIKLTRA